MIKPVRIVRNLIITVALFVVGTVAGYLLAVSVVGPFIQQL